MQLGKPAKVQSAINVTPLVDVVLVLLIIFMVIAPQMMAGPSVDLPVTDQLAGEILCLPVAVELDDDQVQIVIDCVRECVA